MSNNESGRTAPKPVRAGMVVFVLVLMAVAFAIERCGKRSDAGFVQARTEGGCRGRQGAVLHLRHAPVGDPAQAGRVSHLSHETGSAGPAQVQLGTWPVDRVMTQDIGVPDSRWPRVR